MRIGHGFDVHKFGPGDHVMIGGVAIPYCYGLEAHSDGDVLLHALCDALLGAAGLGDIGRHFPDTDPAFSGADSRDLLRRVVQQLAERQWQVANVDMTIVAQAPKMAPYIDQMVGYTLFYLMMIRQNLTNTVFCHPNHPLYNQQQTGNLHHIHTHWMRLLLFQKHP